MYILYSNQTIPNYSLDILVKGKPVTKYPTPSNFKDVWIEGREGTEYSIRLRNNSGTRAKFVVSVDGLSINDGNVAGIASPGYVLDHNETLEIPGWLVNAKQAAKFTFGSKASSYAASQGDVSNTGVIGFLVFAEKYVPVYDPFNSRAIWETAKDPNTYILYGHSTCDTGSKYVGGKAEPATLDVVNTYQTQTTTLGQPVGTTSRRITLPDTTATLNYSEVNPSLGTGFGESTDFKTKKVDFVQASNTPIHSEVLYYDNAKGLNRLGIVLEWQKAHVKRPNPFPADPDYCKKPAGWS